MVLKCVKSFVEIKKLVKFWFMGREGKKHLQTEEKRGPDETRRVEEHE